MASDRRFTVVAFGEILWDLLPDGPVIGGAPFNFTYRINELGHEGYIVSRLGTDDYGTTSQSANAAAYPPAGLRAGRSYPPDRDGGNRTGRTSRNRTTPLSRK